MALRTSFPVVLQAPIILILIDRAGVALRLKAHLSRLEVASLVSVDAVCVALNLIQYSSLFGEFVLAVQLFATFVVFFGTVLGLSPMLRTRARVG